MSYVSNLSCTHFLSITPLACTFFSAAFFLLLSTSELLYHAMLWEAVVAGAGRSLGGGQACDLSGPMFDAIILSVHFGIH